MPSLPSRPGAQRSGDRPGAHLGADPGHEETLPVVQHGLLQQTLLRLALRGEHPVSPAPWDTPLCPRQHPDPWQDPPSFSRGQRSTVNASPESPGTELSLLPAASPNPLFSTGRPSSPQQPGPHGEEPHGVPSHPAPSAWTPQGASNPTNNPPSQAAAAPEAPKQPSQCDQCPGRGRPQFLPA